MDEKEARLERLKEMMRTINAQSYPPDYFEAKVVVLDALRKRIQAIKDGEIIA